jgi:hypothetical protein
MYNNNIKNNNNSNNNNNNNLEITHNNIVGWSNEVYNNMKYVHKKDSVTNKNGNIVGVKTNYDDGVIGMYE